MISFRTKGVYLNNVPYSQYGSNGDYTASGEVYNGAPIYTRAGTGGVSTWSLYMRGLAKTAALELAEHRIRVNLVHPGWTDTPGERELASSEVIAEGAKKLLWGRLARTDEIARGVVFLCDPASDYLTGSSLLIDGGFSLPQWTLGHPNSA